jgi:hypothetical protein
MGGDLFQPINQNKQNCINCFKSYALKNFTYRVVNRYLIKTIKKSKIISLNKVINIAISYCYLYRKVRKV